MPLTLSSSPKVTLRHVATPEFPAVAVNTLNGTRTNLEGITPTDIVEEWGMQSFPASDPPMNW